MANNNGNGKRNNTTTNTGPQTEVVQPVKRADNLFDRQGNQQIKQTIASTQANEKKAESVLTTMVAQEPEQQVGQQEAWWKEEAPEKVAAKVPENAKAQENQQAAAKKLVVARAVLQGADANQVVVEEEASKQKALTQEEERALEAVERAEAAGDTTQEAAMLALADQKNLTEQDKAEMLMGSGLQIEEAALNDESGELQALMAAEVLPGQLGDFDRDAASIAATSPLDEKQTLRNVTDKIRLVAQQLHNHPALMDPNASVEQKATALIEVLAMELDVPTRESIAAHPFTALTEDLIFQPAAMMEINRVAGSRRDIRQLGSFAVILWQITADSAHLALDAIGDNSLINESDFLSGMLGNMAGKMYTDAMARPGW